MRDSLAAHRRLYLTSGGAQGHIVNGLAAGGHFLSTNCLIRYRGRRSGKTMITPLCYGCMGGEVVIVASKGGADDHPAWYLNIREAAEIDLQIATQAFRASLREPEGAERRKAWAFMADFYPFYSKYQAATSRVIPVLMMKPFEEIAPFAVSDLSDPI
jgi:deazaflavin-dependent oxidoreductase (nitroreductase family)